MGDPFIDISDTRSAEDELARWQSGQESCAAAWAADRGDEATRRGCILTNGEVRKVWPRDGRRDRGPRGRFYPG
jgi:hypothetical protein